MLVTDKKYIGIKIEHF